MNDLKLPLDVGDLLPQKPPIVMVDLLLEYTDVTAKTRFFIKEDNLFVHNGLMHEEGLLENIAQTAAAHAVMLNATTGINNHAIGFIGAMSKVEIRHLPRANSTIETELTILHQIQNVTIIAGIVKQEGQILASSEMKVFVKSADH